MHFSRCLNVNNDDEEVTPEFLGTESIYSCADAILRGETLACANSVKCLGYCDSWSVGLFDVRVS